MLSHIKNSSFIEKALKFSKSNFVVKTISIVLAWLICLIPFWIFLGVRALIEPIGFWQNFALVIGACFAIGWLQVMGLIVVIFFTVTLISNSTF